MRSCFPVGCGLDSPNQLGKWFDRCPQSAVYRLCVPIFLVTLSPEVPDAIPGNSLLPVFIQPLVPIELSFLGRLLSLSTLLFVKFGHHRSANCLLRLLRKKEFGPPIGSRDEVCPIVGLARFVRGSWILWLTSYSRVVSPCVFGA